MKRLTVAALLLLGCSAGASQGTADPTPPGRVVDASASSGPPSPGASLGVPAHLPLAAGGTHTVPESIRSVAAPSGEIGTALIGGTISYVDAKYGPEYLALPFPRGTVATVCGPADCVTRRSTDVGPDQRVHPNRIADVSAADFTRICGVPLSAGLCRGTVEIEPPVHEDDDRMRAEDGGPATTLPPTSTEGD